MLIQSFAFHAKDSKTQSDSSDWEVHSLLSAGTWSGKLSRPKGPQLVRTQDSKETMHISSKFDEAVYALCVLEPLRLFVHFVCLSLCGRYCTLCA